MFYRVWQHRFLSEKRGQNVVNCMDIVDKELVLSAGGERRRDASMGGDQAGVQDHFRFAYNAEVDVRLRTSTVHCVAAVAVNLRTDVGGDLAISLVVRRDFLNQPKEKSRGQSEEQPSVECLDGSHQLPPSFQKQIRMSVGCYRAE